MASEYLNFPLRSEAEYRAQLKANLKAEGCSDEYIARLTDDATVRKLHEHEQRVCATILEMCVPGGIK